MELLAPTTLLWKISTVSFLCPCLNLIFNGGFSRRRKLYREPNSSNCSPLKISSKSEEESTSNDYLYQNLQDYDDISWGKGSNSVQVVGIGSRKGAILDYSLDSPFQSSLFSLRFWTILSKDSFKMRLQQRSLGKSMWAEIWNEGVLLSREQLDSYSVHPKKSVARRGAFFAPFKAITHKDPWTDPILSGHIKRAKSR